MDAFPPVSRIVDEDPPLRLYVTLAPEVPVKLNVPVLPAQIGPLLDVIEAFGSALIVTTLFAEGLMQFVTVFVAVTVYVPAVLVFKVATFPGFVTPEGTVQV